MCGEPFDYVPPRDLEDPTIPPVSSGHARAGSGGLDVQRYCWVDT